MDLTGLIVNLSGLHDNERKPVRFSCRMDLTGLIVNLSGLHDNERKPVRFKYKPDRFRCGIGYDKSLNPITSKTFTIELCTST